MMLIVCEMPGKNVIVKEEILIKDTKLLHTKPMMYNGEEHKLNCYHKIKHNKCLYL